MNINRGGTGWSGRQKGVEVDEPAHIASHELFGEQLNYIELQVSTVQLDWALLAFRRSGSRTSLSIRKTNAVLEKRLIALGPACRESSSIDVKPNRERTGSDENWNDSY